MSLMLELISNNAKHMISIGEKLGRSLGGGNVIELKGDVGAGKTTLTKGIAIGLGVDEDVQSPSFTISRVYSARDGLSLAHYDFYRLSNPGIMSDEISETIGDDSMVTVIEWGDIVENVLPEDRLTISIISVSEDERKLTIEAGGDRSGIVLGKL